MKRAEYPLAPLGDSSAPAELHGIQLMPGVVPDPRFNRLRQYFTAYRDSRAKWEPVIAAEIEGLRLLFLGENHGGSRRKVSSITSVTLENSDESKGFQARLREQLGLHPEQARRILQEAEYQRRIETVAEMEDGDVIEVPGKGREAESVPVEVTPRMIALAQQARETLGMPAAPKASRLWAGIAGEGSRVDKRGDGSTERAPCNHFVNIAAAIGKLKTSLPMLDDLPGDQLAELESMWLEIAPAIPVRWLKQGGVR